MPAMAPFRHLTAKDVLILEHSKTFQNYLNARVYNVCFPVILKFGKHLHPVDYVSFLFGSVFCVYSSTPVGLARNCEDSNLKNIPVTFINTVAFVFPCILRK